MAMTFTEAAVVSRRKTVTRRRGWRFLRPGDRLTLCRRVQYRKPGEPLVRLAEVEVVDVRVEALRDVTAEDVRREGFDMGPEEFVDFWTSHMGGTGYELVTRIEWRYLD